MKAFATASAAEQWVKAVAYARAFNKLPPLVVEQHDGEWWVINPDPDAEPQPGRPPRTPV